MCVWGVCVWGVCVWGVCVGGEDTKGWGGDKTVEWGGGTIGRQEIIDVRWFSSDSALLLYHEYTKVFLWFSPGFAAPAHQYLRMIPGGLFPPSSRLPWGPDRQREYPRWTSPKREKTRLTGVQGVEGGLKGMEGAKWGRSRKVYVDRVC